MDPIAEIEGMITIANSVVHTIQGAITTVQGGIAVAQGIAAAYQRQMAIALAVIELAAIVDIVIGAGKTFAGTIETLTSNFIPDTITAIITIFTFLISWGLCLFKNIANLRSCMFYYVIDIFFAVINIFKTSIMSFFLMMGLDLYVAHDFIGEKIKQADDLSYSQFNFSFLDYGDGVRNKCYNCKRLKITTLIDKTSPLVTDITVDVPNKLMPGITQMMKGGEKLIHPLDYLF